jgi:hypothetical protein
MPETGYTFPMTGKLVEFPRKLEWRHADCWYGRVAGTNLYAKVEENLHDTGGYNWFAWNGPVTLGSGHDESMEVARDKAKEMMETSVVVIHPLPAKAGLF